MDAIICVEYDNWRDMGVWEMLHHSDSQSINGRYMIVYTSECIGCYQIHCVFLHLIMFSYMPPLLTVAMIMGYYK